MGQNFQDYVKELHLDAWTDYKSHVDSFPLECIYRGQASADWTLSSSLERSSLSAISDIEEILINEYQRSARSFLSPSEIPTNTLDWLALLQHHGTPTRLIDFTRSPYIAAFFAFEKECVGQSDRVAIWFLNKIRFYQAALDYLEKRFDISKWRSRRYLFSALAFEEIFPEQEQDNEIDCVMPFEAPKPNQRDLAQQSVFLAGGNSHKKLLEQLQFLDYREKPIMTKITLPRRFREPVLRDLLKMNITPATLFPGIDGFARSINLKYSTLATIGETGKWIPDLKKDGFAW